MVTTSTKPPSSADQTPQQLLLIDDDEALTALLSDYLSQQGFAVSVQHRGDAAIEHLQTTPAGQYACAILDIMMPGQDGLATLQQLRGLPAPINQLPVIMLTARGDDIDRIIGLELGADDYLAKPAHPRELLARIQAILRRTQQSNTDNGVASQVAQINQINQVNQVNQATANSIISVNDVSLDLGQRNVSIAGEVLFLTSVEFDVLAELLKSAGQPVSKADLYQQALGRPQNAYDRALDMHISNLRKKLPADSIKTVRGKGYQFATNRAHSQAQAATGKST